MSFSGVAFANGTSGPKRTGKVKEENERKRMLTMTLVGVPWTLADGIL